MLRCGEGAGISAHRIRKLGRLPQPRAAAAFAPSGSAPRRHGPHRDEVRRHLRRRSRPHPHRCGPGEARGGGRARGGGGGLRHGGRDQRARALVPGAVAAARRAGIRHRRRHRRAGDERAARHRAPGERRRGAVLAGLAGAGPYRRRARQGAGGGGRGRGAGRGAWAPGRCRWWPDSRASGRWGASPPWAAAGRTCRRWRWRRRSRPTVATSTRTWTASTPPTRGSCRGRGSSSASPTRRCWNSPRWAPRCCRPARSSWR